MFPPWLDVQFYYTNLIGINDMCLVFGNIMYNFVLTKTAACGNNYQ